MAVASIKMDPAMDGEDFAAVFDSHYAEVYRYLRRRVGSQLAEEMAAETFVVAFRERRRYDPAIAEIRPWLFGIAANLMRRERRRERRELRAYARSGTDPVAPDPAEVDSRIDAHRESRHLAAALASLPSRDREVLLLFAWAELSYEEISQAQGIPIGTVRSRLARCRAQMTGRLETDGQNPDGEEDGHE